MSDMIIRPGGSAGEQAAYAPGTFADDDDGYIVCQVGGVSPFGGMMVSPGSDYASEMRPDGLGRSWFAGMDVVAAHGLGRAWYLRDADSGTAWSAFHSPVCEKADYYEVKYLPGQVRVKSLKAKVLCELTISTAPGQPCELWRVRLENRSARNRTIAFTTYIEPAVAGALESKYVQTDRAILLRRPLEGIENDCADGAAQDLVLVHSSTLPPSHVQTSRAEFVGQGRTMRNPQQLEPSPEPNVDGIKTGAIAGMTVEVDLPIEGAAEFAFCFGLASGAQRALRLARSFSSTAAIDEAINCSLFNWNQMLSAVEARSSDRTFDALVNTWLPYEAYAGWIRERSGTQRLDPARVADLLRGSFALAATAPDFLRECVTSFAAGLTVLGPYADEGGSMVSLPIQELLWLPAAVARYVAETGDADLLETVIQFRDGPGASLREHCERILRQWANCDEVSRNNLGPVLRDVVRDWAHISPDSPDISALLSTADADSTAATDDQSVLPPRVRHIQSICRSLEDRTVNHALRSSLAVGGMCPGDTGSSAMVYRTLVEDALGIRPTRGGLAIKPSLPESWYHCEVTRQFRGDIYEISVTRSSGACRSASIVVDGEPVLGDTLPVFGDGGRHRVEVTVG